MRTLLLLLVLANVAFFAYTRLDTGAAGEAARLAQQVQPDKIKLLTPREVAALGPAKVAELADVCVEWGPFVEADRVRALAGLEPLALGRLLTQRRQETTTAFWVYVPPIANRAEADRRVADLKSRGIAEASVAEINQRYAIALGAYATEDLAKARLADLARRGVANARTGARTQTLVQTQLVIRDPQASVLARVRELAASFPGTDVKVGGCDKG